MNLELWKAQIKNAIKMKYLVSVFLLFILWHCTSSHSPKKSEAIYLLDSIYLFNSYHNSNDTLDYLFFETQIPVFKYVDNILVSENYKVYSLNHYFKYNNYKDTTFEKSKSYLDSIKYFDTAWLKQEEKLDSLWLPVNCWRCGGIYDTLEIYLILPIENSDSLRFWQVHRWLYQTQ